MSLSPRLLPAGQGTLSLLGSLLHLPPWGGGVPVTHTHPPPYTHTPPSTMPLPGVSSAPSPWGGGGDPCVPPFQQARAPRSFLRSFLHLPLWGGSLCRPPPSPLQQARPLCPFLGSPQHPSPGGFPGPPLPQTGF